MSDKDAGAAGDACMQVLPLYAGQAHDQNRLPFIAFYKGTVHLELEDTHVYKEVSLDNEEMHWQTNLTLDIVQGLPCLLVLNLKLFVDMCSTSSLWTALILGQVNWHRQSWTTSEFLNRKFFVHVCSTNSKWTNLHLQTSKPASPNLNYFRIFHHLDWTKIVQTNKGKLFFIQIFDTKHLL